MQKTIRIAINGMGRIGRAFLRLAQNYVVPDERGVSIEIVAMNDLGDNWSLYIEIKEEHELIKNGIYKFLKHPYCLAVLLELGGVSLITNAKYAFILVIILQLPLLLVRIIVEEKVLVGYFGSFFHLRK